MLIVEEELISLTFTLTKLETRLGNLPRKSVEEQGYGRKRDESLVGQNSLNYAFCDRISSQYWQQPIES